MIQRIPSRIPAYGLVAITTMMPMMAMASNNGMRLMKDCDEEQKCKFDTVNPKSTIQFGHAFSRHGSRQKTSLIIRAGKPNESDFQGRWLNDVWAANRIKDYRGEQGVPNSIRPGRALAHLITTPDGQGEVLKADGTSTPTNFALVIPSLTPGGGKRRECLNTAFPVLKEHVDEEGIFK